MPRKVEINTKEITKLYKEGVRVEDIAEQMGCGRTTIRDRLARAGVTERNREPQNAAEEIMMDNLNPLEQFEIEEYESQPEEVKERFKISNLDTANWAMRKINAYKNQQAEVDELAEKELQRINEWKEKEKKKTQRSIEFFESLLTGYLYEQRQIDAKFKVSTPYGSVSTRKQQPKWEIDQENLVAWLKENNKVDLIRTKEEPAIKEIKETFSITGVNAVDSNTGEVVPGIYILYQQEKVVIKTK